MIRSQAGIIRVNRRTLVLRDAICIPTARQRLGKHVPAVNTPQQ
jgi:hypothetical protein